MVQKFQDLDIIWKILIIIGSISSFIMISLAIVLILIFNTNIIPVDNVLSYKEDISSFDDFFKDLDKDSEEKDLIKMVESLMKDVSDLRSEFSRK
jgi:hypothetical protein